MDQHLRSQTAQRKKNSEMGNDADPKIQYKFVKFDGEIGNKISAKTWINCYQRHVPKEDERVDKLMYHLTGVAFEWYGDEIADQTGMKWDTCKIKFIERFSIEHPSAYLTATNRKLQRGERIAEYYNDKLRLLRQTALSETDNVLQLNEGLPLHWRRNIQVTTKTSYADWLLLATQHENTLAKLENRSNARNKGKTMYTSSSSKRIYNNLKKPSGPCKFCLKQRQKKLFHWHNECTLNPNRNQTSSSDQQQSTQPKSRQETQTSYHQATSSDTSDEEVHNLN